MLPIVTALLQNGLSLIGNAVLAKGKDWVEQKTGVKLGDNLTPEQVVLLKQKEMEHEQELMQIQLENNKLYVEFFKAESQAVTDRWKADMASDSWLSKNVRPGTLVYILSAYLLFALMSAFGYTVTETYVTMLGQWGQIVMLAYFGGRSLEKVMEMRK